MYFKNGIHIFGTNEEVYRYNIKCIQSHPLPITIIKPTSTPHCDSCLADFRPLHFSEGLRAMLLRNYVFRRKLVNGLQIELKKAYFVGEERFPRFVTIRVPQGYTGLTLKDGTLPIYPLLEQIKCKHLNLTVKIKSYPIALFFGITSHKAQGSTYSGPVVIHCNRLGVKSKLLYVAMTRAKSLDRIAIVAPKGLEHHFL